MRMTRARPVQGKLLMMALPMRVAQSHNSLP
jgi:hypothetical protein